MKISDLLKLLASDPSQASTLLGGKGAVASRNPQNGGETFDQVLARLASQAQTTSSNAPRQAAEAGGENAAVSLQTRQALATLTNGLNQLIHLLSQAQPAQGRQAQAILQVLGGGSVTAGDIQNILNDLQTFLQKLPASQNPLNLSPDEQARLLAQVIQQMAAQGQIQLGGGGEQPTGNNATVQTVGAAQTQTTQVSINLPNFKMTANFIQEGAGGPAGAPVPNPAPPTEPNQPVTTLQTDTRGTVSQTGAGPAANLAAAGNDLGQNFKNLVQLLMQSGVGQAALTTLIRHTEGTPATPVGNPAQTNPTPSANALPSVELPPPNPAEAALGASNNADTARAQAGKVQAIEDRQVQIPLAPVAQPPVNTNTRETNEPNPSVKGFNSIQTTTADHGQPALQVAPKTSSTVAANEVAPKATQNTVVPPAVENNENRVLTPAPAIATASEPGAGQNAPLRGQAQPAVNPVLPENPSLNPQEVAALNDVVTRLNTAALHLTQGSIGGAGSILTPDSRITMGQVLSGLSATRLSSTQPPTFGNPSVPMNAPLPPQPSVAVENNIHALREAALAPALQPTTPNNTAPVPAAPQPVVFAGPAITLSNALQEPINQTAQPAVPAVVNAPVTASVLPNNGLFTAPLGAMNNPTAAAVIAPPAPANIVAGPTPPVAPGAGAALPQPTTLPVPAGSNPPASVPANFPGTVQAFAPVSLNQTVAPPPTSSAPNVPATAAVGEAVKIEAPPASVVRNENLQFQSATTAAQPASSVIPIAPEAVAPTGNISAGSADMATLNAADKTGPNHSAVLEANTLLNLSNAANIVPDKTHATTPSSVANPAPAGNFDTVSLLNQISQQVAAQASEARTVSRLSFQLIPESLGRVTVQLALVDQSVSARIVVTNPEVRDTLQNHMVDLKAALNQAGLQIDQLQVQVQGGGANLLAQYYQYQQEGFGYRLPASPVPAGGGPENPENMGVSASSAARGLVDVLA